MREIKIDVKKLRDLRNFIRDVGDVTSPLDRQCYQAVFNLLTMIHVFVSLDGRVAIVDGHLVPLRHLCSMYETCPLRRCDGEHKEPAKPKAKRKLTIPNE